MYRLFLLGRTETVHPASEHSLAWIAAMQDDASSQQTRVELLRAAVSSQAATGTTLDPKFFARQFVSEPE